MIAPAIKATSPDPSRRALLWVQHTFPRQRRRSILASAPPLWTERNGEPFCPKTLVFAVFPAAVCFPCHCEPRSGVAISCGLVAVSIENFCHCAPVRTLERNDRFFDSLKSRREESFSTAFVYSRIYFVCFSLLSSSHRGRSTPATWEVKAEPSPFS